MSQLANILTLSRLVLAPLFIVLFLINAVWAALAALVLALLFEITDMLDGYVARNIGQVSAFGKLVDPLADRVARFSVFLVLITDESIRGDFWSVPLIAVIFYRDAVVSCLRTFAAYSGVVLSARKSGKIKAVVQGVGIMIFLSIRLVNMVSPDQLDMAVRRMGFYSVMIPVSIMTAISGLDYLFSHRHVVASTLKADSEDSG